LGRPLVGCPILGGLGGGGGGGPRMRRPLWIGAEPPVTRRAWGQWAGGGGRGRFEGRGLGAELRPGGRVSVADRLDSGGPGARSCTRPPRVPGAHR
jgi:hypothetical protein